MAKGTALPFKSRKGFSCYPEELYMERQEGRKHYDPRVHLPFVERDVVWIMTPGIGVLQAVTVTKDEEGRVVVLDGRQRVTNSLEANRRLVKAGLPPLQIPVVAKRGNPDALFQIRVITNQHRQPDDPVTEAHTMSQYRSMGYDEDDCATLWGYTTRTIRNRLYLLQLCREVQRAVIEGKITVTRAIRLRDLGRAEQIEALHKKPEAKKKRRPSPKRVKTVLASNGSLEASVRAAIQWTNGEITDKQAEKKIPGFKKALAEVS